LVLESPASGFAWRKTSPVEAPEHCFPVLAQYEHVGLTLSHCTSRQLRCLQIYCCIYLDLSLPARLTPFAPPFAFDSYHYFVTFFIAKIDQKPCLERERTGVPTARPCASLLSRSNPNGVLVSCPTCKSPEVRCALPRKHRS
jgi:hypothetical protein